MAIVSRHRVITAIRSQKVRDFLIYGIGQAVNLISPLLVLPYLISVCGEEGLGKIGIGFSFALIAIVMVDAGSYINGTKQISQSGAAAGDISQITSVIFLAKFILLLWVLLLSTGMIYAIPYFRRDSLQMFLSLFIVAGQFMNPAWFFQGVQNFMWITIVNIISKAIYVGGVFLLVNNASDYVLVNAILGIGAMAAAVPGLIWIWSRYRLSFGAATFSGAVKLIKNEFSLSVSQLFFSMYQYAPIIVIGFILGDHAAGIYRIIDQVIMIFRTYLQMFFNFVYADVCAKMFLSAREGLQKWKLYNGLNTLFVFALLAVFFCFAELVLRFFRINTDDVRILAPYFRVGLLIPVLMCFSFALKQLMFATDKNRQYIILTIFATVFTLGAMALMLPAIGLYGAFLSILIAEAAVIVAYYLTLRNSFHT